MPRWRIDVPGGLAAAVTVAMLRAHAIPGAERAHPGTTSHTRLLLLDGSPVPVTVRLTDDAVLVDAPTGHGTARRAGVEQAVRFWLDLDAPLTRIRADLGRDPLLAPLIAHRPGLRVLHYPDGFEAAVMAVLGQQVSVPAGRTFGGRLVAAYGSPGPAGLRLFPTARRLAGTAPEELRAAVGLTSARARTVVALAAAVADGLRIAPDGDHERTVAELLALPGIGAWTVDNLRVRALAEPDAFAPGDLVLRRALGGPTIEEAARRAETWRPWRAYALTQLWAQAAYRDVR